MTTRIDLYRHLPPRSIATRAVDDSEITSLWRKGKDTYEIATILAQTEASIERRLHLALESERRDADWSWAPKPQEPAP